MDTLTKVYIKLQEALVKTEAGQNPRNRQIIAINIGEAVIMGAQQSEPSLTGDK